MKCKSKIKDSWNFCPFCGLDLGDPEKDMKDYGNLGKTDFIGGAPLTGGMGGIGISDKLIGSLFNSLTKSLEKQMRGGGPEIQNFGNGIKITFGAPKQDNQKKAVKKGLTQEQLDRMAKLPRGVAKSSVRRLSDKVVYDLDAPGVTHPQDVFISKLENGYEVKAIGEKKVYVNSLPVDLPLKGIRIHKNGLSVEFGTGR